MDNDNTTISSLTIATFNLQAPCHKRLSCSKRESSDATAFYGRLRELVSQIQSMEPAPDILCVQEIWCARREYVERFIELLGDGGWWDVKRGGARHDGVGVFVRCGGVVEKVLGVRGGGLIGVGGCAGRQKEFDRVALVLRVQVRGGGEILVANTHLTFPHGIKTRRVRAWQVRMLVQAVDACAQAWGLSVGAPKVLAGDFNGGLEGKEGAVCEYLVNQGWWSVVDRLNPGERPVTHYNHKGEQVNVDHIFVFDGVAETKEFDEHFDSEYWESDLSPSSSLDGICEHVIERDASNENVDIETAVLSRSESASRVLLTPVSTTVYPRDLPTTHWPISYKVSDHRPVSVTFDLSY